MLSELLWKEWEPRVLFPAFAGAFNSYEFTVQPTLENKSLKNLMYPLYLWQKKEIMFRNMVARYLQMLRGERIKFRTYRLSSDGELLAHVGESRSIAMGETYIFQHDLREEKYNEIILFVASRGRMDKFFSSPGNMTARYSTKKAISGYRTGFFARPLNCGKGHYGYTGLNPAVTYESGINMGILLINHSSDPMYNKSVSPIIRVYQSKDIYLEHSFGEIKPHGFKEVVIENLFPETKEWKKNNQNFWVVTECKGASLASFHTYRNIEGQLLAIEHSRPSHAQILDYWKGKKK